MRKNREWWDHLARDYAAAEERAWALDAPDKSGVAATDRLLRPAFVMYRLEWPWDPKVDFHFSHGEWLRLLHGAGFEVEDLIEIWPSAGATSSYDFVTPEWGRQWPSEEVWKARMRG